MLALKRKPGEKIEILNTETGESMTLMVVKVHGHHVQVGIDAPQHYTITRSELKASANPAQGTPPGGSDARSTQKAATEA